MTLSTVLAQSDTVVPEDSGGPYVIAAYVVFLVLVFVYVAIMAQRLTKISKMADDLEARLDGLQHSASQGAGAVQGGEVTDVAIDPPTIAPSSPSASSTGAATTASGPSA